MKTNTVDSPIKNILGWAAAGAGVFLVAHAVVKELSKLNLEGKVVLITGGSRGFGLVLARHLADRGAKLAISARSADALELARQDLEARGAQVIALTADVTDNKEVKAMVGDVINHFGRLDVLINNAGIIQVGPRQQMGIEEYQVAIQTNFWAQLYTLQAAIPHFIDRGEGRIVNITSIGGKIAIPDLLHSSSKFASVGLSEGMHTELKKHNIHVITVIPNLMRTGSPVRAKINGDHQKEYSWFEYADLNPLLSQDPEQTAERIIQAIEYGESEVTMSLTGKVATLVRGLAPGWVNLLMGVANKFLPDAATGNNTTGKSWEAESKLSRDPAFRVSNQATARNK
jgi:NAD(P)-dependent dehydrogenase (short-subunit alcohol dehydrogenase family)